MKLLNFIFLIVTLNIQFTKIFAQDKEIAIWINHSITTDLFKVNVTEIGEIKYRNRLGASFGIELRKPLNKSFNIEFGFQIKSFRQSYIFGAQELFITDINFHTPILAKYLIQINKNQFLSLKMGLNGVFQVDQATLVSTNDYSFEITRNLGYFPNIKFGFGYQWIGKHSFEINLLSNFGFIDNKQTIFNYKPTNSFVTTESNGSFVELEIQYWLKRKKN